VQSCYFSLFHAEVTWWSLWEWPFSDLSLQSSVLHEEHNPNWVVIQADWSLSSELAKIEETSFPTVDSVVDKFTYTILRASEHSIPWLSTKPHHVPVSWWMKKCQDAVWAQKQALRNIRWLSTEANLIACKRLFARHRVLSNSVNIIHGKSFSLMCLTPRLPLLCGNVHDKYQANVPTYLSQPFRWIQS
jgi:hypothetical protein